MRLEETRRIKTDFLRSTAADLVSTATIVRSGRRLVFGSARTDDSAGPLAAYSTLTYVHP
jgi:acyl-coenzyme A thioesterase PaaI-like protein